jgi:plasmid stabilization system protein ParE
MLFEQELRAALDQIRSGPQLYRAYEERRGLDHGRVLMPETPHQVYYRLVALPRRVRVVAVWNAVRGRGPRLLDSYGCGLAIAPKS